MNPISMFTYDVYFSCGPIDRSENNLGNILFRELITEFSQSYSNPTSTTDEKERIVTTIISTIQCLDGAFYQEKIRGEELVWEELQPYVLKRKVQQCLQNSRTRDQSSH